MNSEVTTDQTNYKGFLLDIVIYLVVMFLVREVYFSNLPFIANGLMWSCSTLIVAMWRMKARNITWSDLGLRRPKNLLKSLAITVGILITTLVALVVFQIALDALPIDLKPDTSSQDAVSKFGDIKDNWILFFTIIPFIWLQSALEELLDRGFLITWFEKVFSGTGFATVIAVGLQAVIFGFRHSYDLSERSVTVGIIGLIMGIAYVKFGRNLWPLVVAHCVLNTISIIDKV